MKSFLAALAFLTIVPVGRVTNFDAADIARSAGWFPLIGILLGSIYSLTAVLLKDHLPLYVVAVLLVTLDAFITGALHFDGLADTADGFGGGKSREDILRIMRDHAIGSYGGLALAIIVALKVTAYTALLNHSNGTPVLILTPVLGRWSILLLTAALPYARSTPSPIVAMGKRPLLWGTCVAVIAVAILAALSLRAVIVLAVVLAVTAAFGFYCRRRIAGITGDTLGANLQLCECAVLLAFIWTGSSR